MAEARRVDRLLQIHPEQQEVEQQLHVALRLHRAAHHPEAQPRLVSAVCSRPGDEGGDDGVKRKLARPDRVGAARLQREPRPAILQGEAGAGHHDARTELPVDAVDQRDHVALTVGHAQEDRLAGRRRGPRLRPGGGATRIEQTTPSLNEFFGEQVVGRNRHLLRVPDPAGQIGEGQLLGFDQVVEVLRRVVAHGGEVERLEDAQHLQRRDTLPVGRQLPDPIALVVDGDRPNPLHPVRRQIIQREKAAAGLQVLEDPPP